MRRLAMAMAFVAFVWPSATGTVASLAGDNDQRVANTLAKSLEDSPVLKGFKIQVKYREGTARLEGWVRNKQQADEALAIANRTPEIQHVINQLEVRNDAPAAPMIVPASTIKPHRLPPAPEAARGEPTEQPVLRSVLRSPRNDAASSHEPRLSAPHMAGPPDLMVGQRVPHPLTPRVASVSPRPLPAPAGSRMDRPAPMPPPEQARPIPPKPVPMAPVHTQAPKPQRSKPSSGSSDESWGRTGPTPTPVAQSAPRRSQPAAVPMAYPPQAAYHPQAYAQAYGMPYQMAAYPQPAPMNSPMPMPVPAHVPGVGGGAAPAMYDQPYLPNYAWPTYAAYPNYAALTYPKQYSPTAWPYIGPFYPYPQVPLGWRKVTLEWDDGWWFLDFSDDRRHGCGR
jgi:hypothetical protein